MKRLSFKIISLLLIFTLCFQVCAPAEVVDLREEAGAFDYAMAVISGALASFSLGLNFNVIQVMLRNYLVPALAKMIVKGLGIEDPKIAAIASSFISAFINSGLSYASSAAQGAADAAQGAGEAASDATSNAANAGSAASDATSNAAADAGNAGSSAAGAAASAGATTVQGAAGTAGTMAADAVRQAGREGIGSVIDSAKNSVTSFFSGFTSGGATPWVAALMNGVTAAAMQAAKIYIYEAIAKHDKHLAQAVSYLSSVALGFGLQQAMQYASGIVTTGYDSEKGPVATKPPTDESEMPGNANWEGDLEYKVVSREDAENIDDQEGFFVRDIKDTDKAVVAIYKDAKEGTRGEFEEREVSKEEAAQLKAMGYKVKERWNTADDNGNETGTYLVLGKRQATLGEILAAQRKEFVYKFLGEAVFQVVMVAGAKAGMNEDVLGAGAGLARRLTGYLMDSSGEDKAKKEAEGKIAALEEAKARYEAERQVLLDKGELTPADQAKLLELTRKESAIDRLEEKIKDDGNTPLWQKVVKESVIAGIADVCLRRLSKSTPSPLMGAQFGLFATSLAEAVLVNDDNLGTMKRQLDGTYVYEAADGENWSTFDRINRFLAESPTKAYVRFATMEMGDAKIVGDKAGIEWKQGWDAWALNTYNDVVKDVVDKGVAYAMVTQLTKSIHGVASENLSGILSGRLNTQLYTKDDYASEEAFRLAKVYAMIDKEQRPSQEAIESHIQNLETRLSQATDLEEIQQLRNDIVIQEGLLQGVQEGEARDVSLASIRTQLAERVVNLKAEQLKATDVKEQAELSKKVEQAEKAQVLVNKLEREYPGGIMNNLSPTTQDIVLGVIGHAAPLVTVASPAASALFPALSSLAGSMDPQEKVAKVEKDLVQLYAALPDGPEKERVEGALDNFRDYKEGIARLASNYTYGNVVGYDKATGEYAMTNFTNSGSYTLDGPSKTQRLTNSPLQPQSAGLVGTMRQPVAPASVYQEQRVYLPEGLSFTKQGDTLTFKGVEVVREDPLDTGSPLLTLRPSEDSDTEVVIDLKGTKFNNRLDSQGIYLPQAEVKVYEMDRTTAPATEQLAPIGSFPLSAPPGKASAPLATAPAAQASQFNRMTIDTNAVQESGDGWMIVRGTMTPVDNGRAAYIDPDGDQQFLVKGTISDVMGGPYRVDMGSITPIASNLTAADTRNSQPQDMEFKFGQPTVTRTRDAQGNPIASASSETIPLAPIGSFPLSAPPGKASAPSTPRFSQITVEQGAYQQNADGSITLLDIDMTNLEGNRGYATAGGDMRLKVQASDVREVTSGPNKGTLLINDIQAVENLDTPALTTTSSAALVAQRVDRTTAPATEQLAPIGSFPLSAPPVKAPEPFVVMGDGSVQTLTEWKQEREQGKNYVDVAANKEDAWKPTKQPPVLPTLIDKLNNQEKQKFNGNSYNNSSSGPDVPKTLKESEDDFNRAKAKTPLYYEREF